MHIDAFHAFTAGQKLLLHFLLQRPHLVTTRIGVPLPVLKKKGECGREAWGRKKNARHTISSSITPASGRGAKSYVIHHARRQSLARLSADFWGET